MAQLPIRSTFSQVKRGYSPEEVDAYIDEVLEAYSSVSEENKKVKALLRIFAERLNKSGNGEPKPVPTVESEEESRRIVEEAQLEAQRIIESAQKNARDIVRTAQTEARGKAVSITAEARKAAMEAEAYAKAQYESAEKMYKEVLDFRDQLFGRYIKHIETLEHIVKDTKEYYDTLPEVDFSGNPLASLPEDIADDETVTDETAADETAADETVTDETAADETVTDETAAVETVTDETAADETAAVETAADETVTYEMPTYETPADETRTAVEEEAKAFDYEEENAPETEETAAADEFFAFMDEFEASVSAVEEEAKAFDYEEENTPETEVLDFFAEFADTDAEPVTESVEESANGLDESEWADDGEDYPHSELSDSFDALFSDEIFSDDEDDGAFPAISDLLRRSVTGEKEPLAEEDGDQGEIRIDWSMNRAGQTEEDDDFFSAEGETAPEEKRSEGDFDELDALWEEAGEKKGEGALADEFDIVYSARNSARNVEEIGKQPLIAPEAPQKTKKRKFF